MSYTTYSSKPRVIKGDIHEIQFRGENGSSLHSFHPISTTWLNHPYTMSVEARNTLNAVRKSENKICKAYVTVQETELIDEGDVKPEYIGGEYRHSKCYPNRIEIDVDQAIEIVKKYVNPDLDCYPEYKLHLLMKFTETIVSDDFVGYSFDIKATKVETDGSFNWREARFNKVSAAAEEVVTEKPKRGRPKKQ